MAGLPNGQHSLSKEANHVALIERFLYFAILGLQWDAGRKRLLLVNQAVVSQWYVRITRREKHFAVFLHCCLLEQFS